MRRRQLTTLRAGLGAALLLGPGAVVGALGGAEADDRARAFARVLGARHLLEAATLARWRAPGVALAGAGVDAVHALTMVALAVGVPRRRRLAGTSALSAAALAMAGGLHAARTRHRR